MLNVEKLIEKAGNSLSPQSRKRLKSYNGSSISVTQNETAFSKYQERAELLSTKAENAKLQLRVNSLGQELAELKTKTFREREFFANENQNLELRNKSSQLQLTQVKDEHAALEIRLKEVEELAAEEKSTLSLNIKTAETACSENARKYEEALEECKKHSEQLEADLLEKRYRIGQLEFSIENLKSEMQFYKNRYLELSAKNAKILDTLSANHRKLKEQEIAMRQWREENQIASTVRYSADDLKRLTFENASLKEQIQKCRYVIDDVTQLKQDKTFLEEEIQQLKTSVQRYITENNELKIALTKTDIGAEIDPSGTSKSSSARSRRSLSEIDSMSQSYIRLNEQLSTQASSVEELRLKLAEKEDMINKLRAAPVADQIVQRELENVSVDNDFKAALREKDEKIEYLMQRIGLTLDYDPEETRIIHVSEANPLEVAHNNNVQELHTLRKNNIALSLRVGELEGMRIPSADDLPCTSGALPLEVTSNVQHRLESMEYEQEIANLKIKISKVTEQRDRVTKSFMEKTAHYREICSYLLGYDIKLTDGNHLTIRSLYEPSTSEADDRRFIIQHSADGEYHLMSNEYVEEWKDDFVDMYLSNDNCFPAFFAAVTLQLYNKEKDNNSS